jgi:hypothetical protein
METFAFADSQKRTRPAGGHERQRGLAYGLIAAGVRFGAGYPITPWSDVMELLRRELPKYGGSFIQCEDEIASVAMALGASYGGRVAVTGSSGPGDFAEDRGDRLGGDGGDAAGGHRRAARRTLDRFADERRAVGSEHRLLWRARRFAAGGAGAGQCGGLFLHRDRGGEPGAQVSASR